MASREKDEDTEAKGKELWAALERDPLDKEQIKLLLEFGAPANFREPDSRKQTGRTPLHFVVSDVNGDEELMEMLLKNGADTNLSDSFALTPLHLAAEKGNLRAVKKLVENPYSPADRNKLNRSDEIPAQVAERKQQENVLKYLLNDDAYEVDVSSDGDVVNVSSSTGSSVTVNSPGGTVHIMVGDSSTMNVNK